MAIRGPRNRGSEGPPDTTRLDDNLISEQGDIDTPCGIKRYSLSECYVFRLHPRRC